MRKHGTWMQWEDERILENLHKSEDPLTPWMIAHNLGADNRHVLHRCQILANAGFIEVVLRENQRNKYTISGWGEMYLAGEVDAEKRKPSPAPRPPDKVRPGWFAGFG